MSPVLTMGPYVTPVELTTSDYLRMRLGAHWGVRVNAGDVGVSIDLRPTRRGAFIPIARKVAVAV